MDFNEYEPREGWKRFQEEYNSAKLDAKGVALSIALALALAFAYVVVGTLEVM